MTKRNVSFISLTHFKGDLTGAVSAAIVTLPMSIGYGLVAFGPLGAELGAKAALLGVYCAIFSGFFAALLGGSSIQITGPKAPLTLVMGSVVTGLLASSHLPQSAPSTSAIVLGLASVCVLIAGLSQILTGLLGFGRLLRYVPQPVVAGFMNGIAILLVYKQIRPLVGLRGNIPLAYILADPSVIQPLCLLVGMVTITVIYGCRRLSKFVPPSLLGLVVGTTIYYVLKAVAGDAAVGPVIGRIDFHWPRPDVLVHLFRGLPLPNFREILPNLVFAGLVLGLVASLESLLSSVVCDQLTGTRHDPKRELEAQGIGNVACAIFGALPGAGSIPRSMANFRAGARTRLSGVLSALIIFFMVTILGPLVGRIPLSVIAGIISVVGISLFDRGTLRSLKKIATTTDRESVNRLDLFINLVVAITTLSINLIAAVSIGVVIASAIFVSRIGKTFVKRRYFGDRFHSRKMRKSDQVEILQREGTKIAVLELQGPLFFGSAENLAKQAEELMHDVTYLILNLRRVTEVDSTGAATICQIARRARSHGKHLLLSHLRETGPLRGFHHFLRTSAMVGQDMIFHDTDTALEWSEDRLLKVHGSEQRKAEGITLSDIDLFQGLTPDEIEVVRARLIHREVPKGYAVFEEGEPGRDLCLLSCGSVSVRIRLPDTESHKRVITYSPGACFGEIAFLDGGTRSASVLANENSELLCLSHERFLELQGERPEIAAKLLTNIALQLARRLRTMSLELRVTEDR